MLNRWLYQRLEKLFGEVKVASENQPPDFTVKNTKWGLQARVNDTGEEYRVSCPFCSDTRFRLYIPHIFGMSMKLEDGRKVRFPAFASCFNETECMGNKAKAKELRDVVLHNEPPVLFQIDQKRRYSEKTREVIYPDRLVPLTDLPDDHVALDYLRARGFDRSFLDDMGFSWIPEDFRPHVAQRIFIPILNHEKKVVGAQCRLPYEPEENWMRYFTLSNSRLSGTLYNYFRVDAATVVVCEGVFDALVLDPLGVASFKCSLSNEQLNLLAKKRCVIIGFDPDVDEDEMKRRHLGETMKRLRDRGVKVGRLQLPSGEDPASMPRDDLWTRVKEAIDRAR